MESLKDITNQELKGIFFHRSPPSDPSEAHSMIEGQPQEPTSSLEGFHIKCLTPCKMVNIQSILATMNIKLVKYYKNVILVDNSSAQTMDKVYFRRKYRPFLGFFLVILRF